MVMEEERVNPAVVYMIGKAVNSTAVEVDPRLLKAIKSKVRDSDTELRHAAKTLMDLMKHDHAQVRFLALLIIDELFMRSKLFRTLLVENLDQLLSLGVGFRSDHPLPAPASVASRLRSKSVEFLEKWNESFGVHYRQLRMGYDYLKNNLRLQFPNLQANAARIQQERRGREMRTKEILLKKFETFKENFSSINEHIKSTIDEINECLVIVKDKDEDMPLVPLDDEEMEEFRNSELRQIRLDSLREGEKVHENSENKVVFDTLRELFKALVTKHLPTVQEWISVLIRVEVAGHLFRDSALKDLIDIKNLIHLTRRNCEESGCDLSGTGTAEEDIWEDGTIATYEKGKSGYSCSKTIGGSEKGKSGYSCSKTIGGSISEDTDITENAGVHKNLSNGNAKKNLENGGRKSDPIRGKLLHEAPVLKWGSFLDNWGSNSDALANQRGLDVEAHWGRVDQDAVIPSEKIAELNVRASIYEEQPAEIQPCRAPLKKGKLCQRRDLRVCPFHGRIIPRDDEGKPINESLRTQEAGATNEEITQPKEMVARNQTEELTPDADDSLVVDQLLKQAIKNVRERDGQEAEMRKLNKRSLKKAKLAKVREHNEAVLRDAAIASTSRSAHVGEDMEMDTRSKSSAKSKKQTLASMLKKKSTSKSRLEQRLLNVRTSDATGRNLMEVEEARYRDAFPNQW